MNPVCASVLKGKHWPCWKDLPYRSIGQTSTFTKMFEMDSSFKLIGLQHPFGIFAADVKPGSLTEEDPAK